MKDMFGPYLREGDVVEKNGQQFIITHMCRYMLANAMPVLCSCPVTMCGKEQFCIKWQLLESYNKDHNIQQINDREVNRMKEADAKTARKLPNGNFVAEDDIVKVKTSYTDNDTYNKIGRCTTFTGRLVSFGINTVTFDISKQYLNNVVGIPYNCIESIERVEEH